MKTILLLASLIIISSCGKLPPSESATSYTIIPVNYLECKNVPAGTINVHSGCPGDNGTWNNYIVVYQANGTTVVDCGESESVHPTNQNEFDSSHVNATQVSLSDYKSGPYCASGGTQNTDTGYITDKIWQKN